jgi:hypothetical protein
MHFDTCKMRANSEHYFASLYINSLAQRQTKQYQKLCI